MTGKIGVAISTTGDEHRLRFLETCAQAWWSAIAGYGLPTTIFVTVDGDLATTQRVGECVAGYAQVVRVGQPAEDWEPYHPLGMRDGRLGVAANKNTGIEVLMGAGVDYLFLSDDDTWPKFYGALAEFTSSPLLHAMVCWGKHRKPAPDVSRTWASWDWPRGSVLYIDRFVVDRVGGMDERFGPGGHEHVEWSRRIYQSGYTPAMFCSPYSNAQRQGMGARDFWHAEDMQRAGEPMGNARQRRKNLTSVRRRDGDWDYIESLMAERDGDTSFVPFKAAENLRAPATLL